MLINTTIQTTTLKDWDPATVDGKLNRSGTIYWILVPVRDKVSFGLNHFIPIFFDSKIHLLLNLFQILNY